MAMETAMVIGNRVGEGDGDGDGDRDGKLVTDIAMAMD